MNALAPFNVLLAEPDRLTRETLAEFLASEGVETWTAEDGRSALRIAQEVPIHAGIIDVSLPDFTGLRLLAMLRQFLPIPVLFIGTTESKEVRLQAADAGAWSFLPMPFVPEIARTTIHVFAARFFFGAR